MSDLDTAGQMAADPAETEANLPPPEGDEEADFEAGDADDAEPDGDEGEEDAETVEEVEYDLGGGQKLKVKANATAKEVLEQAQAAFKSVEANYTRKQQAVAEQAKSVQARAEAVQKLETLSGEALQEYSKGLQIRQEIEQLSAVDLRSLWQSNPDQARQVSDMLAMKQAEFQRTVNRVAQIETGMTAAQQAEMARIEQEGVTTLEKRIKGFSQKVPEIIEYVSQNYGIDKDHAAKVWKADPATAEMAYKAMMYDRMQTKAAKPAAKPAQAQPVKAVRGSTGKGDAPDPDKMTPDQMARYLGLPKGRR